jgi:hypothetical protein
MQPFYHDGPIRSLLLPPLLRRRLPRPRELALEGIQGAAAEHPGGDATTCTFLVHF